MYAIDPVQRLRLLRVRIEGTPDRAFHDEMIDIFAKLRDLHTGYVLPNPYRQRTAYLPFQVEEYDEKGTLRYIVTQVSPTLGKLKFKPGVIVTHWNGTPIARAVELHADRAAGSNVEARRARGLESLTTRWMGMLPSPDEEWVDVTYLDLTGATAQIHLPWQVFVPAGLTGGDDELAAYSEYSAVLGIDLRAEVARRVRKLLFSPEEIRRSRRMAEVRKTARSHTPPGGPDGADMVAQVAAGAPPGVTAELAADFASVGDVSVIPDVFTFQKGLPKNKEIGYLRIWTFAPPSGYEGPFVEDFLQEARRILGLLPDGGLILDVRGNAGGIIWAGERLLQMLTPRRIEPVRFHFINSPLTRRLCAGVPQLQPWSDSLGQAVETGAAFSRGLPLTPEPLCNDVGQVYQGPVVLLTDARCYSTTDIFAAGFQDHDVGRIMGTHNNTGAGGANVWNDTYLQTLLPKSAPFQLQTVRDASFSVAIRQCVRVGSRAGTLIEDLGVRPDEVHRRTRDDVLKNDADLIAKAAQWLSSRPKQRLAAVATPGVRGSTTVHATSRNLDRLDVYVDNRPHSSVDVTNLVNQDTLTPLDVPARGATGRHQLDIRGFRKGLLVVAWRGAF
jgi:hypothetical protein